MNFTEQDDGCLMRRSSQSRLHSGSSSPSTPATSGTPVKLQSQQTATGTTGGTTTSPFRRLRKDSNVTIGNSNNNSNNSSNNLQRHSHSKAVEPTATHAFNRHISPTVFSDSCIDTDASTDTEDEAVTSVQFLEAHARSNQSPLPAFHAEQHKHQHQDHPTQAYDLQSPASPTRKHKSRKRAGKGEPRTPRIHKLQSVWTFWWHDKAKVDESIAFRKSLTKLGTFRTLESFASIYPYVKQPTALREGIHFHLFKGAKSPCWERYAGGGMFVLCFDLQHANEAWERACFAAVGYTITSPCFQGLAGVVRRNKFYMQCWFKQAPLEDIQDLRTQLLHLIHHQMATCPVRIVERIFP